MSATNRGPRGGGEFDYFGTPAWAVHRFLDHPSCPLRELDEEVAPQDEHDYLWLDPGAGEGNIILAVQSWTNKHPGALPPHQWLAAEIREECLPKLAGLGDLAEPPWIGDFLELEPEQRVFDAALGNPPYKHAAEFLHQCLRLCRRVCLLLRLGFMESEERSEFMSQCPPDVFVLPNRPSFDSRGTDATTYGWLCWDGDNLERASGKLYVLDTTPELERSRKPRKAAKRLKKASEETEVFDPSIPGAPMSERVVKPGKFPELR